MRSKNSQRTVLDWSLGSHLLISCQTKEFTFSFNRMSESQEYQQGPRSFVLNEKVFVDGSFFVVLLTKKGDCLVQLLHSRKLKTVFNFLQNSYHPAHWAGKVVVFAHFLVFPRVFIFYQADCSFYLRYPKILMCFSCVILTVLLHVGIHPPCYFSLQKPDGHTTRTLESTWLIMAQLKPKFKEG